MSNIEVIACKAFPVAGHRGDLITELQLRRIFLIAQCL